MTLFGVSSFGEKNKTDIKTLTNCQWRREEKKNPEQLYFHVEFRKEWTASLSDHLRITVSICSGKEAARGTRGWGRAQSCSGWRSSPPEGSSSSQRSSAAAPWSPGPSGAERSPRTGRRLASQLCRSCSAKSLGKRSGSHSGELPQKWPYFRYGTFGDSSSPSLPFGFSYRLHSVIWVNSLVPSAEPPSLGAAVWRYAARARPPSSAPPYFSTLCPGRPDRKKTMSAN